MTGLPPEPDARDAEAFRRARRGRNIALAVGLVVFVVLIFIVTLVHLGANVANRPF